MRSAAAYPAPGRPVQNALYAAGPLAPADPTRRPTRARRGPPRPGGTGAPTASLAARQASRSRHGVVRFERVSLERRRGFEPFRCTPA